MKCIYSLVFLLLSLGAVRADTIGDYTFELDGAPLDPGLMTTEGENPVSGDAVYVEGFYMRLDEPGTYSFTLKDGKLQRKFADGRSVIVACAVAEAREEEKENEGVDTRLKAKPPILNPLATMDDATLKSLRGVRLDAWPDGIEKQLTKLDLEKVCLYLNRGALGQFGDKMPPIPTEVRMLILDSGGTWSCDDTSAFATLKKLRFLDLNDTMPERFDFALLKGMPLEYLSVPSSRDAANVDAIASLDHLKTLVVNSCNYLGDGKWIGRLGNLRQLYAGYLRSYGDTPTTPLDLSFLPELKKLTAFHVQNSQVKNLPSVTLPALKRASLILCSAPPETIEAFSKANPQAQVRKSMNAELAARVKDADKVRARSGGVCHRRTEQERTIHESRDLAEIKELAQHFGVEESESGGHCMCCGDPTFEFYKGDQLVAMIAFHHGRSVRWSGGTWPGDGMLTSTSANYLIDWLAKHGYTGPQEEALRARRQALAAKRRRDRYNAILPPAVSEGMKDANSMEEAVIVFEKNAPDVQARATLYLKLYGCDDGTWALSSGWDGPLEETLLPGLPKEVLHQAIKSAPERSEESLGAIRWVFGKGQTEDWQDDPATLERLAKFALTHPREDNRWRTLAILRDLKSPKAVELLRSVLKDGTQPRTLSQDETYEPGGQRVFHPNAISLPEGTSDKTAAALCLKVLQDEESAAEVEKIYQALGAEARKEWDEAVTRARKMDR